MDLPARRQTPTVRLRRLAGELRAIRENAGLSTKAVAEMTEINAATLYRIETAKVRPQRRTLVSMLNAYKITDPKREELLELLKQSAQPGWLAKFENEIPELYLHYVSFEAEASSVSNYETIFVPGLLQTSAYAYATVTQAGLPIPNPDDVTRRVDVRMQRQAHLRRAEPLNLWAIMDEAVLHRAVGGSEVMAGQLFHLLEAGNASNIVIQVIPFGAGAHAGMPGSFAILDFPDEADSAIVYSDGIANVLFLESPADLRRFAAMFAHLRAAALSPSDSASLIESRLDTFRKGNAP